MDAAKLLRRNWIIRKLEYPRSLQVNLNVKLLFIILGVLLVGVGSSSFLLLTLERQHLIDGAQDASTRVGNAIEAGLQHAMMSEDRQMANGIIAAVIGEGGIERVRVLNAQGAVRLSSRPLDVEQQFDRQSPLCQGCHSNVADPQAETIISPSNTGHEVLLTVSPILNRPACVGCHDPQARVLGLLMIETSLVDLENNLTASEQRILLSALVTFILMAGVMLLALGRFVTRPVAELARGMRAVGGGNLEGHMHSVGHDEIGELARAFDAMRRQLKTSRAETAQSNQELAVLYETALAAGRLRELAPILRQMLQVVATKLHMQTGLIYLWDDDRQRFERILSLGLSDEQLADIDRRRACPGGDLTGEIANGGNVHYVADMSTSKHFKGLFADLSQRSYINVPLKSQGKIVGTMELTTLPGQPLTGREIELVKAVGYEIGIAIDNTALFADAQRREKQATTLYDLGMQITASLELSQVMDAVAEGARQVLAADIGIVGLVDADRQNISVRSFAGTRALSPDKFDVPLRSEWGSALTRNQPLSVEEWTDSGTLSAAVAEFMRAEAVTSILTVPLWHAGASRGLVGVMTRRRQRFSTADHRLLTRLAQQTVVAIENAQLYHQVRYVAVLEERDRLAREMHDNLAQALGFLNFKAEIVGELLAQGRTDQAQASLLELKQVTQTTYSDVREAIFSLRTTVSSGWGLVPAMAEYLAEYRAHYGIDAQLVVDDTYSAGVGLEVGIQISRIVQEALTNVRKHSGAGKVRVRFEQVDGHLQVSVEDDGRGFDATRVPTPAREHFGLEIMRERAREAGGILELDSKPSGTRVVIRVPLKNKEQG